MQELNEADIAAIMEELPVQEQLRIFRLLPKDQAADVFAYLPIEVEQEMITALSDREAATVLENLFADDAADVLEEMPASVVKRLLAQTKPETRSIINALLKYPEDSAGSIMTVEFVDVKEENTVEEAIARIRRDGVDKETINTCYVLDARRRLVGTVSLRSLLLSRKDELIGNIMQENAIYVTTLTDQETVAQTFQKYDFLSMPVVDQEHRLVGIVTVDDIMDIIQEENTEDIEKMAAILPSDHTYLNTGILETCRKRIPWLLLLMISATFTSQIIAGFQSALSKHIALSLFIPMLMDSGGNAGSQASVTIIRGISLNEIAYRDVPKILAKEFLVGFLCGLALAAVSIVKLLLIDRVGFSVAIVVALTLLIAVIVAKIVGCTLPILAKRIGFDPAVMASPFITTIVDAISLFVYFQIASHLLGL